MHPEQQRVNAAEVRIMLENIIDRSPTRAVLRLMEVCVEGGMDGKSYYDCFYGHLTKGSGESFVGNTSDEVCTKIRKFGESLGVEIRANRRLDPIEQFVAHVGRDDNRLTSTALDTIFTVCNESLLRRPVPPMTQEDIYENAGEAVGV